MSTYSPAVVPRPGESQAWEVLSPIESAQEIIESDACDMLSDPADVFKAVIELEGEAQSLAGQAVALMARNWPRLRSALLAVTLRQALRLARNTAKDDPETSRLTPAQWDQVERGIEAKIMEGRI